MSSAFRPKNGSTIKSGIGIDVTSDGFANLKLGAGLAVDGAGNLVNTEASSYTGRGSVLPEVGTKLGDYFLKTEFTPPNITIEVKNTSELLNLETAFGITVANTGRLELTVHTEEGIEDASFVANNLNLVYVRTGATHSYELFILYSADSWQSLGVITAITAEPSELTASIYSNGTIIHSVTQARDLVLFNNFINITPTSSTNTDTVYLNALTPTNNSSNPSQVGQFYFSNCAPLTFNYSALSGTYIYGTAWEPIYSLPFAGYLARNVPGIPTIGGIYSDSYSGLYIESDGYTYIAYSTGLSLNAIGELTLNIASNSNLGGIKVGAGLTVDGYGVLSVSGGSTPIASSSALGGIKVGAGLAIDGYGVLSTKVGAGLAIDGYGALYYTGAGVGGYTLPEATSSSLGGIKIGAGLVIDGYGAVAVKTNKGLTIDGYGNVGIKVGTGLTVDGYGALQLKLGTGLTVDAYGNIITSGTSGNTYLGEGFEFPTGNITLGSTFFKFLGGVNDPLVIAGIYTYTDDSGWYLGTANTNTTAGTGSTTSLSTDTQVFSFEGVITPTVGIARWYPYADSTLLQFYASIEYSPLSTITLQLKKNGINIPAGLISISAGSFKSTVVTLSELATPSDYLTVDVVSGDSGANIFATLVSNYIMDGVNANPVATNDTAGIVKIGSGLEVTADGTLNIIASVINSPTFVDNHDISVFIPGLISNFNGSNVGGSLVHMYIAPQAFTIDGRAYARALVPPVLDKTFTVKLNSLPLGTIAFTSNNAVAICTIPATIIQAGDFIQIFSPQITDTSLADVAITIGSEGALAFALPIATNTTLGMVTAGTNVTIADNGALSTTSTI